MSPTQKSTEISTQSTPSPSQNSTQITSSTTQNLTESSQNQTDALITKESELREVETSAGQKMSIFCIISMLTYISI